MGSIPGPGKEAIGKAQDVNVLGGLFSEEVVDPVDLCLLERLVGDAVELGERFQGGAERLLVDHSRALGQMMGADGFCQGAKGCRWDGHVMDELRVPADLLFSLFHDLEQGSGIGAAESATGEAQPSAHLVPGPLRRLRPELFEALTHAFLEVFI